MLYNLKLLKNINISRGATTAEKLRGPRFGSRPKAGLGVGCGRGSPLPLCGSGGLSPENL